MNDMSGVIIPKSDQWNFDDFLAGPMTFTIKAVRVKAGQEQPVEMTLEGTPKFYRPCKSMARILVNAWGADSSKYAGRSLTLYGDPKVKWGGMEVGGIRISHMSHLDTAMTMALTMTRANKKPYTVKPLMSGAPAPESSGAAMVATQDAPAAPQTVDDAALVSEIEGWVKKRKFDMAYDLCRGIADAELKDGTKARIDKAKAFVDAKSGPVPPLEP